MVNPIRLITNYFLDKKIEMIINERHNNDQAYQHRVIDHTTWLDKNKGLEEQLAKLKLRK